MDSNTKNMLVITGATVAGGWGGSWATGRLGAALGLSLGPWGSAAGAVIGALLGSTVAKSMIGETPMLSSDQGSLGEPAPEAD